MTLHWDMGAHALYVWPAYAVFVVVFGGLALWAWRSAAKARAELEKREETREMRR